MIEHFHPSQLDVFVDGVIEKAKELCFDRIGNFVIQHLVEHGSIKHKTIIAKMLSANVEIVANDAHASGVLLTALTYTTFKHVLAFATPDKEGLVVEMAIKSYTSSKAAKRLLEVCVGHDELEKRFTKQVSKRLSDLETKRFGCQLLDSMKEILDLPKPPIFRHEPKLVHIVGLARFS